MPSALLVTQDLNRAGAQRQCVELAVGLARCGWGVGVVALEPDGPLADDLRRAEVRLHACPRRFRWDLTPAAGLAALARRERYDVVHSFLFLPNFYARLAGLVHRPPTLVSSLRSTGVDGWPRYLAEVVMAPLCDVVIANSEAGRRHLVRRGVAPERVVVVRNGLDLERFRPAGPAPPPAGGGRLGMVAQLEARKDHAGLLRAFALVLKSRPRARLVLAGDGSRRPVLERLAEALGIGAAVEFRGTVHRPERLYPELDVYVQSSASEEGTSNSILEAMASGLAVVATDVGGNREVVVPGVTGLIVPPRAPEALASALLLVLGAEHLRRRLGRAGAARAAACYSRDAMVEATVQVYGAFGSRAGAPARTTG